MCASLYICVCLRFLTNCVRREVRSVRDLFIIRSCSPKCASFWEPSPPLFFILGYKVFKIKKPKIQKGFAVKFLTSSNASLNVSNVVRRIYIAIVNEINKVLLFVLFPLWIKFRLFIFLTLITTCGICSKFKRDISVIRKLKEI